MPGPVTVPDPSPDIATVSCGFKLNVAMTSFELFIVTLQVEVDPLHAPLQPEKTEFDADAAVSVTLVPSL
jgi:hypothetical protein